jgi:twitching motility protein PilT
MSKIDRFLGLLASRGGLVLRFDPGAAPVMELPGGHRQNIMPQELSGAILDGLAKEILPEEHTTTYLRGEQVVFDHVHEGATFQFVFRRSKYGTHILIAPANRPLAAGGEAAPDAPTLVGPGDLGKLEPFLRHLLDAGGSDLYLSPDELPAIRKDGHVVLAEGLPVQTAAQLEDLLLKIWLPTANLEHFQGGQDTEFAVTPPGLLFRLRVRVIHDHVGPSLAIRVIPRLVPDADTLGLSDTIRRVANLNKGLVLLAGPSGSGKTTTMASLLDLANHTRKAFVITIQDSVEFEFPTGTCLIRQKEVGRDPLRRRRALQAALQMDPDILALGEIRDPESLELALQGAQMGCLVLAQVPASSLVDTFHGVDNAFPADLRPMIRSRLGDHLRAVFVHTLLERIGGGRAAAIETLFNNPTIATLLREGKFEQIPAAMKGNRYGQTTHNEALVRLIQKRRVDPMEAYRRCQDRDTFIAACKKAAIAFDPRGEGQITDA